MTPIAEILPAAHTMTLDELQTHKNERDAEVRRLREEMRLIHYQMEPKWVEQIRSGAGPANLSQRLEAKQMPTAVREEK